MRSMGAPWRVRVPALALGLVLLLGLSVPASAAGRTIFITKYDESFQGHAGVTFELYKDNPPVGGTLGAEDVLEKTAVTDAAGAATFTGVALGDYWIHEVTPAGYVDNANQSVKVKRRGKLEFVFSNTPKPANTRVNDPTGDVSLDDGTHVFDFGPSVGVGPGGLDVLVAWNDTTGIHTLGGVSITSTALSADGGTTWEQLGKLPVQSGSSFNLGDPAVLYDPIAGRWVVASSAVTATQSGLVWPIHVHTSGSTPGFWNPPVVATPNLVPGSDDVAHGAVLELDPGRSRMYLPFILSHGDGTSEATFTSSANGGATFTPPVTIFGPDHIDFVDLAVGPNGNLHSVAASFDDPATYDILFSGSTDGGATWSSPTPIVQDLPRSGVAGACTGSGQPALLGQIFAADAPTIASSPFHPNRLFMSTTTAGPGGDESDVLLFRSNDAGSSWHQIDAPPATPGMPQFHPSVEITPDGRVAVAYYDARSPTQIDASVAFYSAFSGEPLNGFPLTTGPFPPWQMNPSFDSDISSCHGMDAFRFGHVGSGVFVAWTDGRDPGPAGNGGVDPNIYFAHTEGPAIPTDLSAVATFTARKIKVEGSVAPTPLPGAEVVVTLFRKGPGGFEQIGRRSPTTGAQGAWATSFRRPSEGRCRLVVGFQGSEGREPSVPGAATFPC